MISAKVFPAILITLDLAAAIAYGAQGWHEWRKVVYWSAAAALTYVVTW